MDKNMLNTITSQTLFPTQSDRHIIFGVDGKFIAHSLITILSVIKHSSGSDYHFHLVSSELSTRDNARLSEIFSHSSHGLTVHHLQNELFSTFPTTELFTRATYYRFLAPLILSHAERILYLDADIVCLNPLDELWQQSIEPDVMALVVGESEELQTQLSENIGLRSQRYFNAGMMLINVQPWNSEQVSERAFELLAERGHEFQYLDQDALNVLLEDRITFIASRFNTITMLSHEDRGYKLDVPKKTCLLHYAGADKPWQIWNEQQVCHHYRDIYQVSPLASVPYDKPRNFQQAKRMYKLLFRNNQLVMALYWRVKYIKMRYF